MRACEIEMGSVAFLLFIAQQHIIIKIDKREDENGDVWCMLNW